MTTDDAGRKEYEDGVVDTLEALLRETAHTSTQTDVLMAAFDSNRISSELTHEARDRCMETDIAREIARLDRDTVHPEIYEDMKNDD